MSMDTGTPRSSGELQIDTWISALGRMSSSHPDMGRILHVVERLQDRPYRSHALLYGAPGTGKDGLAKLLHRLMHQNPDKSPCERLSLGGRSHAEMAAELFGPGASGKGGAWERARGGSLILDELLVLPAELQRRLHEALSQQRFTDPAAVVVIAQTDGNLHDAVDKGTLRHDLAYKLGRIVLAVPPLRERAADLSHAALWIANRVLRSRGIARSAEVCDLAAETAEAGAPSSASAAAKDAGVYLVAPEALEALHRHPQGWPGNFRELEAVLERAILLYSDGEMLAEADVERSILDSPSTRTDGGTRT